MTTVRANITKAWNDEIEAAKKIDLKKEFAVQSMAMANQFLLNSYMGEIPEVGAEMGKANSHLYCPVGTYIGQQQINLNRFLIDHVPAPTWKDAFLNFLKTEGVDALAAFVTQVSLQKIFEAAGHIPHPVEQAFYQTTGANIVRNFIVKPVGNILVAPTLFGLFGKKAQQEPLDNSFKLLDGQEKGLAHEEIPIINTSLRA